MLTFLDTASCFILAARMTIFSASIIKRILNCRSLMPFCPSSQMDKSKPLISAKQVW